MVNKTKRENPQFQFRGFGGVQCESLFSTKFPTFSLSLVLSRSLSLRTRRQKKSFVAHHARPDDSGEEETLKIFFFDDGKRINKFLDDPAEEEEEEGRSV